jgi:tetraprenyl-beta-curcumene synthase
MAFGGAAERYWLRVFPAVASETRRRRGLAQLIPDPRLRRLALVSLERKRCNVEGAAAFELLAPRSQRSQMIRALVASQTLCDYLDLLAEQPAVDPVANGYRLHEALIAAVALEEDGRDYYAYSALGEDGGYLAQLIADVRGTLAGLPGRELVLDPLRCAAQRIATYQSFNHGDRAGSFEPFRRWACAQLEPGDGLSWWEMGAGFGSTLPVFALIAAAASPGLSAEDVVAIEDAYFPWIGVLHTLLDSLVDFDEDVTDHGRCLLAHYRSPEQAAGRLAALAEESLRRAAALPASRRHVLILVAMMAFYMCDARAYDSAHARAVVPALRGAAGAMVVPASTMIGLRHALHRRRAAETQPPALLPPAERLRRAA